MKIDRLLSIVVMLLNRKKVTAKELSEKFEVSLRTIYRDIDSINAAGIPIIPYQGYNGGYCIMENYTVSKQLLTLEDMIAILSSLKSINHTFTNSNVSNAIDKIESVVPNDRAETIKRHLEQYAVDILPWGVSDKHKNAIATVSSAIGQNLCIEFTYVKQGGVESKRTVEPMTIVFKGYGWYLFAYCQIKSDYRVFKIARMDDIIITNNQFTRRAVSYENYFDFSNEKLVTLVLKVKKEMKERLFESFERDQITVLDENNLIVTVDFPETPWVYTYLLGYGSYVEVLEPSHIRKDLQREIEKMNRIYKK